MPPKRNNAGKTKELLVELDDIQEIGGFEDEIRDLRQRLAEAEKEVADSRLQSLNDRKQLSEIIQKHDVEQEHMAHSYEQKLIDVCREKDGLISDMQQRLCDAREEARQAETRAQYREPGTAIVQEETPSIPCYMNDVATSNYPPAARPFMSSTSRDNCIQRLRFDLPPATPLSSFPSMPNPDPWQENIRRPSRTRFDVPLPRQLIFDGKMSWDSFIKPFQATAMACRWTEEEKLFRLTSSLRGEAAEYVFNQVSPEITESLSGLQRALESRFREKRTSASYLNELENRKFTAKEKLLEFAADIKRLVHKGYPTADEITKETLNVRYFLRGLNDQNIAVAVGMKDPKTIDDAREMVETYYSLRDYVGRNQKVRSVRFEDTSDQKNTKAKRQSTMEDPKESGCLTAKEVERMIEMKLNQGPKKRETSSEAKDQVQGASFKRNKKPIDKNHIECFKCHKYGHFANECFELNKGARTPHLETKEN